MINDILANIADAKTSVEKARESVRIARALAARMDGRLRLAMDLDIEAACLLRSLESLDNLDTSATVPIPTKPIAGDSKCTA